VPSLAVIDELSAVAAEQVARLFGRARAAGMSLLLGTQELSDLRLPGRELLLEQVLGNLSTVIAHRQLVPASALAIAGLAGTQGAWKTSWASDGRHTRTRAREPLLRAEELCALGRGRAAVITLAEGASVRLAQIYSTAARD
jgi:TraM recognition site of TraD and TraG